MKKILVQRADRLGDLVFSLPVIQTLRDNYPNAYIVLLTSEIGTELVQNYSAIDDIVTVQFRKGKLVNRSTLIQKIKSQQFDIYISLWNHPDMARLGYKCKIPMRIGDGSNLLLRRFYNRSVTQNWCDYSRHQVDFNLDLLQPLKLSSISYNIPFSASECSKLYTDNLFEKKLDKTKKTLLIFVSTGGSNYPIPFEAVVSFIKKVHDIGLFNIILCGEPGPGYYKKLLSDSMVLDLVGKTTIIQMVGICERSHFVIGPDTGLTHLAALFDKPILFFSPIKPNPPVRWGPSSPYVKILRQEYRCQCVGTNLCNPSECFGYVDGDLLYRLFTELMNDVSLNQELNVSSRRRLFLLSSIRVLYIVRSQFEYDTAFSLLKQFRREGLIVFPFVILKWDFASIRFVLKYISQNNINVVQGSVPLFIRFLVSFYLGTILQYVKPIFISTPFQHFISLKDYLSFYCLKWNKCNRNSFTHL